MKAAARAVILNLIFIHLAFGQAPDFLHPRQKGPFPINGLSFVEFDLSGYKDPVTFTSPVATIDQIVQEIKATNTNLVKITLNLYVKNVTDNAYDPDRPFPSNGKADDILAFGRKLTAQGIPCVMQPFSQVENKIPGQGGDDKVNPADRRAFMAQHIPRMVYLAQLAEGMGCEYFIVFGDEIEHLAVDPNLTDLWLQLIAQLRGVFSGRLTSETVIYTPGYQPQLIGLLDVFGIGHGAAFSTRFTDQADPPVSELVDSYQRDPQGHSSLLLMTDLHTLYQKPIAVMDVSFGSFVGSNVQGESMQYGQFPASQFTVDYQEQVNLYAAAFQALSTLNPNWMLGVVFDSLDRYPYAWKDVFLPPYLTTVGESLRGKPALQILTQAYQSGQAISKPVNGWWYALGNPGTFYPLEAENGVVRLGIMGFSTQGNPQWSLARCAETAPGVYAGTAEQYSGGRALDQAPKAPAGISDGSTVRIVFTGATTGTLQIGTQSFPIQRYQFSDQWASPMLNPIRAGWWDEPKPSGRGYFLEAQGNTLRVGGLTYSASGAPGWFTATGAVDSTGNFSSNLSNCSASGNSSSPVCAPTTDMIRLAFKSPWDATLTLGQEAPTEIRRYRPAEIGLSGSSPSFALANPAFQGEAAVVNSTSLTLGVSPGSMATITGSALTRGVSGTIQASLGPLPYAIRGTSVLVNGLPAPVQSIQNNNGQEQITFQVPWAAQGTSIPGWVGPYGPPTTQPTVSIVVVNNGAVSPALQALFFDVQPRMATTDGVHVAAVHSDNSPITSQDPAHIGEVITVYGTGFGRVTPSPGDGFPALASPPSTMDALPRVTIQARDTIVQFAGLSVGSTDRYEFKVLVPDGVGTGDIPLSVLVGGQASTVPIPVQGKLGVQSELIRNGSFTAPLSNGWYFAVSQGAAATADQSPASGYDGNPAAHISVTKAAASGLPKTAVSFGQYPIPLTQGVLYQFQFWAKSSNPRNVNFGVFSFGGGSVYSAGSTFSFGTSWQHFVTYIQPSRTGSDGQLIIFFGDQTGEVWLEGISLIAVSPPISHFSIQDHTGTSVISPGTAPDVTGSYGVVQPAAGGISPAGLAVFGFRQNNVLVSEAGVPASLPLLSGRIYAEVNGPVNTGLAIANPSNHPVNIFFYFTDSKGNNFGNGNITIDAGGQIAQFLSEAPFNISSPFSGTFTFNASVSVAVIALSGFTNERHEFLITTLPVTDLGAASTTAPLVFPHFADGGGWTTQIVLVNPTDSVLSGSVQFRDPSGQTTSVNVSKQLNSSFAYSIPPRSSQKFETAGEASSTTKGAVRAVPSPGTTAPSGLAIFSFRNGGITVAQAGVPAVAPSTAFRLYAEAARDPSGAAAGLIETGVAITNSSPGSATVTLQLYNLSGSLAGSGTLSIPANGQVSTFINQIPGLTSIPSPFQGVLRVSSTASISVVGLRGRYNERSDFLITTTPATDESAPISFSPVYFPRVVDGGGYTTQLILFANLPTTPFGTVLIQSTSADVLLYKDGRPLNLNLQGP